jgi:hypothetical protein
LQALEIWQDFDPTFQLINLIKLHYKLSRCKKALISGKFKGHKLLAIALCVFVLKRQWPE